MLGTRSLLALPLVLAFLAPPRAARSEEQRPAQDQAPTKDAAIPGPSAAGKAEPPKAAPALEQATFAGGCFWCMEPPFEKQEGVTEVVVGYTGGRTAQPTYEEVCSGKSGHAEAIQVTYDPAKVSYRKLLNIFWHNIDPTQQQGQFADRGSQYRTAIFYRNETQKKEAEESLKALSALGKFKKAIATEIVPASKFHPAEAYHQDYYKTHEERYKAYRKSSGREAYLERTWGAQDP